MTIKLSLPLWLLTLVFTILKLTGVITWSWLWVFSPVWVPTAIGLAFLALVLTAGILIAFGVLACLTIVAIADGV